MATAVDVLTIVDAAIKFSLVLDCLLGRAGAGAGAGTAGVLLQGHPPLHFASCFVFCIIQYKPIGWFFCLRHSYS